MGKSISVTKAKKKMEKAAEHKQREINPDEINKAPEDSFAFGGIPKRDLKKNLGCG